MSNEKKRYIHVFTGRLIPFPRKNEKIYIKEINYIRAKKKKTF